MWHKNVIIIPHSSHNNSLQSSGLSVCPITPTTYLKYDFPNFYIKNKDRGTMDLNNLLKIKEFMMLSIITSS